MLVCWNWYNFQYILQHFGIGYPLQLIYTVRDVINADIKVTTTQIQKN